MCLEKKIMVREVAFFAIFLLSLWHQLGCRDRMIPHFEVKL